MIFAALSKWWILPARVRLLVPLLAFTLLALGGLAPPPKAAPGPSRFSANTVVITMDGVIDAITSASVRRRIAEAEDSGADALVVQINSPGGELGAIFEITSALKKTTIKRTVAWVNPQALSGGAMTALACKEIVISGGGAFGDAAPIRIAGGFFGAPEIVPLPATERAKILSPVLADIVGSARLNGHDEKLAQGMVTLGVELWLVEDASTGKRLFIDRAEYALLFDGEPPTSHPRLFGAPRERPAPAPEPAPGAKTDRPKAEEAPPTSPPPSPLPTPSASPTSSPNDLIPASPQITRQTAEEASMALTEPSFRTPITPADKGKWKLVEYVSDGTSLFTFSDTDMLTLRVAAARVNSEAELKQYLGATTIITLTPAWYESFARIMQNELLRGLLIIVIVLGLFIELVHPGLILPGAAAGLAILGFLLPEILMGLAGWWEVVMIVGGIALIGVELFLMPGVAIAGSVGILSLLAGLVLLFVPAASPTFPGAERSSAGLLWGVGFVMMGVATAATFGYYMSKNMRTLPILGRLILSDNGESESEGEPLPVSPILAAPATVGQEGVALTPLRPAGKADFGGRVVDVVADGPLLQPGQRVRVLLVEQMRVVVEAVG